MSEAILPSSDVFYSQIFTLCISPDAECGEGTVITLECAPNGRHTRIGAAVIGKRAIIDGLAIIGDGAVLGDDVQLKYCGTIEHDARVGGTSDLQMKPTVVGIGATVGAGAKVAPSAIIGNVAQVSAGAELSGNIGTQSVIETGIRVTGDLAPHTSVRHITQVQHD